MILRFVPVALLLVALVGCANPRLTLDNYQRLEVGMSRAQVEAILGSPKECHGALMVDLCTWGRGARTIHAQFLGGEALAFQYQGLN
ncbi:outer membrane protein assembly factor BamE domain-containing protein [Halomonas sp. 328]|uniref:outer membrane protein assembly factor BamE domain-containing protein n=1 Tax=Halomonas sp. 328 TaxID=2776704 RepID=UPI001E4D39BB|nr:outer membrane protein assembly factor BamE [Halomonas sp. 328]